jgi:hypothetical protein
MTTGRWLAAILAVDVVGCSRLMGEDEAVTAVRENCEARYVPDTLTLRRLAKTHR